MASISGVLPELSVVSTVNGPTFNRKVTTEWQPCRAGIYNPVSEPHYRAKVTHRVQKEEKHNIEANHVELEYTTHIVDLAHYRASYT